MIGTLRNNPVTQKSLKFLILIALILWSAGFLFPLFFYKTENYSLFEFLLKKIYGFVCIQEEQKTMDIMGSKLLVCARCTGIYIGGLFTALFLLLKNISAGNKKYLIIIAVAVNLTDFLFVSSGVYNYSKLLSFIAGTVFGSVVIIFIFDELNKYSFEKK